MFNKTEKGTKRRFRSQPLVVKGNQEGKVFDFGGRKYTIKTGKALKWSQKTINKRLANNPQLIYWTSGGEPRYKTYLDEHKGIKLVNIWTDIKLITSTSSERLDYPTQKPIKLLKRIIKVSSSTGDVVLDVFNGSGTTTTAARELGRRFIGIDKSPTACRLAASRIGYFINEIAGHPSTVDDLELLPEFEVINWVCWKLNATQAHGYKKAGITAFTKGVKVPLVIKPKGMLLSEDIQKIVHNFDGNTDQIKIAFIGSKIKKDCHELINKLNKKSESRYYLYTFEDIFNEKHLDDGISVKQRLV